MKNSSNEHHQQVWSAPVSLALVRQHLLPGSAVIFGRITGALVEGVGWVVAGAGVDDVEVNSVVVLGVVISVII